MFNHQLWMEHDVSKMALTLATTENLGVNFGALDDDLQYDDAVDEVRMAILALVECRLEQKKSW